MQGLRRQGLELSRGFRDAVRDVRGLRGARSMSDAEVARVVEFDCVGCGLTHRALCQALEAMVDGARIVRAGVAPR